MKIHIERKRQPLSIHVVWLVLILAILAVYRFILPPHCLFHEVTGYPCLSRGLSRAANSLFEGDLGGMIYNNPLAVIFCAGLFFFSLLKLLEFIFKFKLNLSVGRQTALKARVMFVVLIVVNWLFLIVTGR